jgi:3-phosphoshikimate 1-carboxyvinyltransferase
VAIGCLIATYKNKKIYQRVLNIGIKYRLLQAFEIYNYDNTWLDKKVKNGYLYEPMINQDNTCTIQKISVEEYISDIRSIIQDINRYSIFAKKELSGIVKIVPSKSVLHRYIIVSVLSNISQITFENVSTLANDILTTLEVIKSFEYNYKFNKKKSKLTIFKVEKSNIKSNMKSNIIQMNESGTTLRLMLPVIIQKLTKVTIIGKGELPNRPIDDYLKIFEDGQISYSKLTHKNLPLVVEGQFSEKNTFTINGNKSSQFISGLILLIAYQANGGAITVKKGIQSLGYINLTIQILNDFNVKTEIIDNKIIIYPGKIVATKQKYLIEQDYSARAFYEVLKQKYPKIKIVPEINPSNQPDFKLIDILKNKQSTICLKNNPDIGPILAISLAEKGGKLTNIKRLKYKESNRIDAICQMLDSFNVDYQQEEDSLTIKPSKLKSSFIHNTYNDHRICMSQIVAALMHKEKISLSEIDSCNKSDPLFIDNIKNIGGIINEK